MTTLCGKFTDGAAPISDNGRCPVHHIQLEKHCGIMSPYGIGTYSYCPAGVEWEDSCAAVFDFVADQEVVGA
jgi:hypothetical protein